ncbi:post-transcriptional regulator [Bacillus sp. V3-13]|uniref:post-transcriptional regulator n=1 Tax=Bacillus sp. V3-13 TaxID=2053728 RepID=UPI000C76B53B|nr:post-transcriptional regulator [Bacillus sp. V3-13]PLR78026.1 post-transcriptional regulator [Bacillus sp. V3-13]
MRNIGHEYDRFYSHIKPALHSKLDEFKLLGYETITEHELWDYMVKKKWKKTREDILIHEIVQDILSVKVNEYMSFATVEAFKQADFHFSNEEDRRELLK